MIMDEGMVVGMLILAGGDSMRRIRGEAEHLKTCENEEERLGALKESFSIKFSDHDKARTKGMVTELKE